MTQLPSSSDTAVILKAIGVNGSGDYRCEVSGEAPSFKTVTGGKYMTVVGKQILGNFLRFINDKRKILNTIFLNIYIQTYRMPADHKSKECILVITLVMWYA